MNTGRLFIIGVTLLISFLAYSSQIFIFWKYLGGLNAHTLNVLIPFNIMIILIFWNYYLTCTTDPGRVPKNWDPKENQENIEIRRTTRTPRFCRTCNAYKPPRTHHCRTCKRCVLKMDHHCPWTNNCIGYFNYGHFIRFVFWVDVTCTYHLVLMIKSTLKIIEDLASLNYMKEPSTSEIVFLVLNYTAVIPVLFSVGILSMYHFYCMLSNTTTIENWEKDKVLMMVRRGKIKEVVFPYDVGMLTNIQSVLGNNILLWCYPQQMTGTGIKFPISKDADPTIIWPPKDPTAKPPVPLPPKPWSIDSTRFNNLRNVYSNLNNGYRTNISNGNNGNGNGNRRSKYNHVRRDSEGYVVRDLSLEERAMLVEEPFNTDNEDSNGNRANDNRVFDPYHNSDGSTLYSSSEEEIDEETRDYNDHENYDDDGYDEFDDENYPEHIGVGDDEVFDGENYNDNRSYSRNNYYDQSEGYIYNGNGSIDNGNDDDISDDDIPLGQKIAKKQLEAMEDKHDSINNNPSPTISISASNSSSNKISGKFTKID